MHNQSHSSLETEIVKEIGASIAGEVDFMTSVRRDLHRNPELGFQETRTAALIADELDRLGLMVQTNIADTGVVGLLECSDNGPTVLIRFDMDALPMSETTGAPYASSVPGVSHACGHDGHVAMGLAVARALTRLKPKLNGSVKLVFQPAEELLTGAKRMVDEGVLTDPPPDYSLAMHLWNSMPVGWFGTSEGPLTASGDSFHIEIVGKGGHGATPHETRDPIVAAAHTVVALQSIVSRNLGAMEVGVLSVTQINGGETFNVIPASVDLVGTIRSYDATVRETILTHLHLISEQVCAGFGCQATVTSDYLTRSVKSDPPVVETVARAVSELFPNDEIDTSFRTMASEDMAYLMDGSQGCYFYIGSANPERGLDAAHHSPRFDFDERSLERGAAVMVASVVSLLT